MLGLVTGRGVVRAGTVSQRLGRPCFHKNAGIRSICADGAARRRFLSQANTGEDTKQPAVEQEKASSLTAEQKEYFQTTDDIASPVEMHRWAYGPEDDEPSCLEPFSSQIPLEVRKSTVFRVFQPAHVVAENPTPKDVYWVIKSDKESARWSNEIMSYSASDDPLGVTGIIALKFKTVDEAIEYCRIQGLQYYVDKLPEKAPQTNSYAENFLPRHVRKQRERLTPKKLAKTQFDHKERGKSCWINLKHTSYGGDQVKKCSQTEWTDKFSDTHSAETWYAKSMDRRQNISRRLAR